MFFSGVHSWVNSGPFDGPLGLAGLRSPAAISNSPAQRASSSLSGGTGSRV